MRSGLPSFFVSNEAETGGNQTLKMTETMVQYSMVGLALEVSSYAIYDSIVL